MFSSRLVRELEAKDRVRASQVVDFGLGPPWCEFFAYKRFHWRLAIFKKGFASVLVTVG